MLTPRQMRFADEYVLCGNATEAARRAGYSDKTARQIAAENLSKPVVLEAIHARQAANAAQFEITKEDVLAGILKAIDMAREQKNPAAMIQGCATIARMLGYFEPETIKASVSGDVESHRARFTAMSDAELIALTRRRLPT